MNRQEVTRLLAIISAYYGQSKADAETMVGAWHLLLKDYDYSIAEQAVLEFAKNDKREYSQFPNIGQIIASIKEEEKSFNVIRNIALRGGRYEALSEREKKWISEERFEKLSKCSEEYLLGNIEQIKKALAQEGVKDEHQRRIIQDTERIKSS